MMTSRLRRRFVLALVLTLVLGLVSTASAAASPLIFANWLTAPARLWARAWSFISQESTKAGGDSLPDGTSTQSGDSSSPSGAPLQAGAGLDPIG